MVGSAGRWLHNQTSTLVSWSGAWKEASFGRFGGSRTSTFWIRGPNVWPVVNQTSPDVETLKLETTCADGEGSAFVFVAMETFFRDKDVWIVGSVCLVATFLWRHWRRLFSVRWKGKTSLSADKQVMRFCTCTAGELGSWASWLGLTPGGLGGLRPRSPRPAQTGSKACYHVNTCTDAA